jgi:hypothetical protein
MRERKKSRRETSCVFRMLELHMATHPIVYGAIGIVYGAIGAASCFFLDVPFGLSCFQNQLHQWSSTCDPCKLKLNEHAQLALGAKGFWHTVFGQDVAGKRHNTI